MIAASLSSAILLYSFNLAPPRVEGQWVAPAHELTVDVDAASIGVTYARRVLWSRMLVGLGGAVGLSPILGTVVATGSHYDPAPHVTLLEVASGQAFTRVEATDWLRIDAGLRAGLFIQGNENYTAGEFAALFVAPSLGWRWLWIGPRVSGAVLTEGGNNTAPALTIDYLLLRFAKEW